MNPMGSRRSSRLLSSDIRQVKLTIKSWIANPRSFDTSSIMLPTRCWSRRSRSPTTLSYTISLISLLELPRDRVSLMTLFVTLCSRYHHSTSAFDWTRYQTLQQTTSCTILAMSSGIRHNCCSRLVSPLIYRKAITVPRTLSLRQ